MVLCRCALKAARLHEIAPNGTIAPAEGGAVAGRLMAAMASVSLVAVPAVAQTAEETVAFLVKGIEEFHSYGRFKVSKNGDVTSFHIEKDEDGLYLFVTMVVRRIDDCRYRLSSRTYTDRPRSKVETVDFQKIDGIRVMEGPRQPGIVSDRILFDGPGYQVLSPEAEIGAKAADSIGPVKQERIDAALRYLRANFCGSSSS